MAHTALSVEIPHAAVRALDVRERDLAGFVRRTLAVALYREGRLSLGKARELAGLPDKWAMLELLSERGVAVDYGAEDAREDLETLNRLTG